MKIHTYYMTGGLQFFCIGSIYQERYDSVSELVSTIIFNDTFGYLDYEYHRLTYNTKRFAGACGYLDENICTVIM
jgi:hypothetical protein